MSASHRDRPRAWRVRVVLVSASLVPCGAGALLAQGEAYFFATAGLPSGEDGFADRWCGPDMLPYTEDDLDLPAGGNAGGTWGFSWIDSDGDGVLADEERIFTVIRRGDDDVHSFSTKSYPQYGVIAESETWIDYHEARNAGPSATLPGEEGNDFEHNDSPGWEGESNYYWLNNARADQRGAGGSRYYFEHRNGAGLDEIEGFTRHLTFQNNLDDPNTALNERGDCRREYMRSSDAVTKGLLIPVAGIAGLADGELDPLFGWYSGDMAKYVRDVLGPKLADPGLTVFEAGSGCGQGGLPPTHVMLLQVECPIAINANGACGSLDTAKAQAAYWGIQPEDPECGLAGETTCPTAAVYRASHVLLFNDDLTRVDLLGVASFSLEPEDGVARNLWVQDDFWRDDPSRLGRYATGGAWTIVDDTSIDRGCGEVDKSLRLGPGAPGYFEAPLSAALDPAEGAIYAIVELGEAELAGLRAAPGDGVGADADTVYQIILMAGSDVVAWAELGGGKSTVNRGGTLLAEGLAASPDSSATGDAGAVPILDPLDSSFTRFILRASSTGVELLQAEGGEYASSSYAGLDDAARLASLGGGISREVTAVRIATSGGAELASTFDGFAVLSNLDPDVDEGIGPFVRGDSNADGESNITDGVFIFNFLFLGGAEPPCMAAADASGQGDVNISSGIYVLNFLFLGGASPVAPFPDCGRSSAADDATLGCVSFPGCP